MKKSRTHCSEKFKCDEAVDTDMLITLEGIDGAGKGTVIEQLKERLPEDTVFTREPSPVWTGEQVRRAINKDDTHPMADYHLFVADRAEHIKQKIQPALDDGKIVISDRYKDSTRAYQREAIAPYVSGMSVDEYIEQNMCWVPEPDLTLLFDVDAETSVKRTGERDKYEKKEFLREVRQNYLDIYKESTNVFNDRGRGMRMIDATREKELVVEDAVQKVINFVNSQATSHQR